MKTQFYLILITWSMLIASNNNIIEVHLRPGNLYDYNNLVPVWKSWPFGVQTHWEHNGYKFIEDFDNADGHLDDPRIGFMVK